MGQRRRENRRFNSSLIYQFVTHFWSSPNRAWTVLPAEPPGNSLLIYQFVTHFWSSLKRGHYMVEFSLFVLFFFIWIERNILCEYYIAAFYHTMSSKSTQKTKKANKKTPSGTQTRKSRPLSPGAATFEALNNPAYDTSERHFSPPMLFHHHHHDFKISVLPGHLLHVAFVRWTIYLAARQWMKMTR